MLMIYITALGIVSVHKLKAAEYNQSLRLQTIIYNNFIDLKPEF